MADDPKRMTSVGSNYRAIEIRAAGDRRLSWLEYLIYAGLVAILVTSALNGLSLEWGVFGTQVTVRPDQVVILFLMPLLGLAWLLRRVRIRIGLFDWVVVSFLLSNAVASVFASTTRGASIKGTILLGCYTAMYLVVRQVVASRSGWVRQAANWVLGFGIVQAAYTIVALVVYTLGVAIGGLQIGHLATGSVATEGTFWEANLLGAYLGMIIVVLIIRYLFRSAASVGWVYLLGLLVAGLALPLTMTRAAAIAVILSLLAIAGIVGIYRNELYAWKSRTVLIIGTLGCVLLLTVTAMNALVSVASRYPNLLLERWAPVSWMKPSEPELIEPEASIAPRESVGTTARPRAGSRNPAGRIREHPAVGIREGDARIEDREIQRASYHSVSGRMDAWMLAVEQWRERPILGRGTLGGASVIQDGWWYSSLVQALHDTGLVGFSLLLWIHVGSVFYPLRAWVRARRTPTSEDLLAFGAGNGLLAFTSQFSSFYFVGFPWVFLGLSMGAVEAFAKDSQAPAREDRRQMTLRTSPPA